MMMRKISHRRQGSIDLLETIGVVNENGVENPSMPPVQPPLTFDYVLVAKSSDDEDSHLIRKQKAFIEILRNKKLNVQKREQKELKQSWARWSACFKGQPITNVRNYLGEKVALYFLWLGWYTFLLIPASVIGLIVFLYGLAFYNTSPLISTQGHFTCATLGFNTLINVAMQVSLLFDNEGTVAFAMFMAVWATVFLEFWKRHRSSYVSAWKVFDWSEEEEELIMEIVNNPQCEPKMHRHSYLCSTMVLVLVTLMLLVIIGLTHVLVVCRVIATVLLAENSTWPVITENSQTVGVMLGAVLHYITITVMTRCHPSGCLTDLFIQMSIIMVLKQTFNNIFEYAGPWFSRWLKRKKTQKFRRRCFKCYKKECMNAKEGSELCENCKLEDLHRNYSLIQTDRFSLFNEFLEMVIQFSFTTIFVAAFPLAPLLALLNNIIEIRLDAIKMVSLERRLVPTKANDIGVWTDVLEAIGVLAVIANGLVIGISSDFIPRLVYQYLYGPCASGSATGINCMVGYINNTLSIANISDEKVRGDFKSDQMVTYSGINVTHCSYRDYRSNEDFSLTNQFWVILAARLVFIILFEVHTVHTSHTYRIARKQDNFTKLHENGNAKRSSKQKKANKLNSM
ncbi:anoctamin-9-like protein [Labeo rohita]|uniref:Anoctamin n=1 Tax=Labeo rohita TaxID=84645 RepID=A0A498NCZ3_LABRO|nr:anoctamin-9-like protein [Labeo rohita]